VIGSYKMSLLLWPLSLFCAIFVFFMLWILNRLRMRLRVWSTALPAARSASTVTKPQIQHSPLPPLVTPKPTKPPPHPKATTHQPYNAFLVLDVEGTCQLGSDWDYPNEIIEFPVVLLRFNESCKLETVDEFRTFVRPTWRPTLSDFCTSLTGITQAQVDSAPTFVEVVQQFSQFLEKHGLIDSATGMRKPGVKFCWCTDTRADIQNFVVKQCHISAIPLPNWITGDFLDVRRMTLDYLGSLGKTPSFPAKRPDPGCRPPSFNIPTQLISLGLEPFHGRQHSGIDDARNISRILTELANNNVTLVPNCNLRTSRRWDWMGRSGKVLYYGS
jgi:3'-5' exoribonuclease 1